jgi:hypothetical protein
VFGVALAVMIAASIGPAAGTVREINGPGFNDVSLSPDTDVRKDGPGTAIITLEQGSYTVWMNGPGRMFLIGLNDFRPVLVTFKDGDGDLIWVPTDQDKAAFPPKLTGTMNGKGKIRMGTWDEVKRARKEH